MKDSVTVRMSAPPAKVWDLLTDVTRIGELSPETFEGEWLDGATGPATGARFRGHVRRNGRGPTYWTVCEVEAAEPEREFAFVVLAGGKKVNHWSYVLVPVDGGAATDVTESFALHPSLFTRVYWTALGWARGKTNRRGMQQTLERAKAIVEA